MVFICVVVQHPKNSHKNNFLLYFLKLYLKSETFFFDFFAAKKEGIYLFIRDCKAKVILVFALTVWP
jgi:hypothetical protein